MRTISASAYSDYTLCPLIYDYKYLHNYQDIFAQKTEEINKGNIIHKLIESHSKGIVYPDSYINQDKDIKQAFNYYIEKYSGNNDNSNHEYVFNLIVDTGLEKVVLSGRIDQIIINENNLVITDWKTTGRKTKVSLLTNKLQMDFYAYVMSKITNIDQIEIKLAYLNLEQEEIILINQDKLIEIEKNVFEMIKNTHPDINNYVPKPLELATGRYICEICNFYNFCKDYI